jgi:starch phosphorylase
MEGDRYFVLADFKSYLRAQQVVVATYANEAVWWEKAILNVARMGWFSSDRTLKGYAKDVWGV